MSILASTKLLGEEEKKTLFKRMHTNFGRTALCLSGGGSFAYYHFGVVKALLDANLLPEVITGTSGGARKYLPSVTQPFNRVYMTTVSALLRILATFYISTPRKRLPLRNPVANTRFEP